MKHVEVFTPTTQPTVTYIGEHLVERRKTLSRALEMGGAVITLSGPSKSGKTVFVETVVGSDNLIQVTGAGIASADALWKRVLDKVGTAIPSAQSSTQSSEVGGGAKLEGGIPLVAKAEGNVSGKVTSTVSVATSIAPDFLNLIIRDFANTGFIIFIDDFHYIPKAVQEDVATLIKEAVRHGVLFVCAAVPYHADDVILANSDLRGRMIKIDFDYWNPSTLLRIALKGFEALKVEVNPSALEALAMEAAGSPQLMQALCLNICYEHDILARCDPPLKLEMDVAAIGRICTMTSRMNNYTAVIHSMKDGPKTRGEPRKTHQLHDGRQLDVYPLILAAVAQNPPELTVRYANLLGRIGRLCKREPPSGSSVTGACAQMSEIANGTSNGIIVEWDGENDVLDIRDPYLLFAMRWCETSKTQ